MPLACGKLSTKLVLYDYRASFFCLVVDFSFSYTDLPGRALQALDFQSNILHRRLEWSILKEVCVDFVR